MLFGSRRYNKKLDTYMMLLRKALFMKDYEKIIIVSPKETKEMNRFELFNWLQNYWK